MNNNNFFWYNNNNNFKLMRKLKKIFINKKLQKEFKRKTKNKWCVKRNWLLQRKLGSSLSISRKLNC